MPALHDRSSNRHQPHLRPLSRRRSAMTSRTEARERGQVLATVLEGQGQLVAARVVRDLIRAVDGTLAAEPGRCKHCDQPLAGRQRQWCSEACRRRQRA